MSDDLSVFDPIPETREPVGECRRCGASLYFLPNPDDYDPYALLGPLCWLCWVRVDAAEAEYIAVMTHGGASMSDLGRVPASASYDDERAEFYTSMHRASSFQPLADDVCMDCLGRRDQHDHNGFRIFTKDEPMTWAQRERTMTRIVCHFRFMGRAAVCTVCGGTIRAGEDDRECQNCGEHYHFGVCSHECGTCSSCGRERLLLNGRCQLCRRENR